MIDGEARLVNRQNVTIAAPDSIPGIDDGVKPTTTTTKNTSPESKRQIPTPDSDSSDTLAIATAAAATALVPEWLNTVTMMTLIFGGCCSNVFTLEAMVKKAPGSGTLITCFQFLITALLTWPRHFDRSRGIRHLYLKPRAIPFTTWLVFTGFFLTINVLNNKAFNYKISVPLHIILRSAGPVTTMVVGYLAGRRYSKTQVVAVLMLFAGVVQAAISDARSKGARAGAADVQRLTTSSPEEERSTTEFLIGFGILFLALTLSAIFGLFTERMYARHGRQHAEETLFYSHALSLPFFLMRLPRLQTQTAALFASPPSSSTVFFNAQNGPYGTTTTWLLLLPSPLRHLLDKIPLQVLLVVMNGLTQYVCIRGVNQLSARSSSLTVGIVLNVRKLVSLLLSIWLFGNDLGPGVLIGAAIVFVGGGLYALPSASTSGRKIGKSTTVITTTTTNARDGEGEGSGVEERKKEL